MDLFLRPLSEFENSPPSLAGDCRKSQALRDTYLFKNLTVPLLRIADANSKNKKSLLVQDIGL